MKAYVVSTALDAMVDAVVRETRVTTAWRPELTVDLGYAKGSNMENWPVRPSGTLESRGGVWSGWQQRRQDAA